MEAWRGGPQGNVLLLIHQGEAIAAIVKGLVMMRGTAQEPGVRCFDGFDRILTQDKATADLAERQQNERGLEVADGKKLRFRLSQKWKIPG